MMVNLGAAVNVIHGIRTHHAQTTGCPTWDEAGAFRFAGWCPLDAPCHADVLLELANEDGAP